LAGLPKRIECAVLHKVVPEGNAVAEIALFYMRQRTELQKKLVIILIIKCYPAVELVGSERDRPRHAKAAVKIKGIHQEKGTIMVEVIASEPVGNRCLGQCRFQCRMRIG